MKFASILSAALMLHGVGFAGETAYQALRALGKERPKVSLNRVLEVQGQGGSPQPETWKITLDDPDARGGVREFEFQNSRIISERTPIRVYNGGNAPMDFQKLNLDSAGAFAIANKEASAARIGFDGVDYLLHAGDDGHAPVWTLKLVDLNHHTMGTLRISADNGAVISREGFGPRPGAGDVSLENRGSQDATPDADDQDPNQRRIGRKLRYSVVHGVSVLEEFFTGQHTLEDRYGDPNR